MPPFDGKAFAADIVESVKQHVSAVTRPIVERVTALEQKIAALPVPKDGKSPEPAQIAAIVAEHVAKIPAAPAGKDADPAVTERLVMEEVARQVKALPVPLDGKSVTVDELAPILERLVNEAVAKLPKAKDGVGLAGGLIDREGRLVLTLTDGTTKELAVVVGRDADMTEIARIIKDEVAKIPAPKDGKDGFGFDDLTVTHDGEREFVFRFTRGEQVKEFPFTLTHVLDRGVWREGKYVKGDGVTFGGSFFICQQDTEAKPETSTDWRLSIKRGRDGKDADPQVTARMIETAIKKIPPSKLATATDKV